MTNILRLALLMVLLAMCGCTSVTKQSKKNVILDTSQESAIGGTGTSSADLRSMAERVAREIAGISWPEGEPKTSPAGQPHRIALLGIDNETRFPLNPNLIKDRLLADLVEFSQGTNLQFTENKAGANYFLTARITALSKGSSEGVSDYLLYSFKLNDEKDTVIWMRTYETKKQGKTGVMYR